MEDRENLWFGCPFEYWLLARFMTASSDDFVKAAGFTDTLKRMAYRDADVLG